MRVSCICIEVVSVIIIEEYFYCLFYGWCCIFLEVKVGCGIGRYVYVLVNDIVIGS